MAGKRRIFAICPQSALSERTSAQQRSSRPARWQIAKMRRLPAIRFGVAEISPVEKFGCSPCTAQRPRIRLGREAHGRYEHWLWPMNYPKTTTVAAQCHAADMVTEHATVLNRARTVTGKGLHRLPQVSGFDNQDDMLVAARQQILQLSNDKQPISWRFRASTSWAIRPPNNESRQSVLHAGQQPDRHRQHIDAQVEQLQRALTIFCRKSKKLVLT